jgi:hypothetical protein
MGVIMVVIKSFHGDKVVSNPWVPIGVGGERSDPIGWCLQIFF